METEQKYKNIYLRTTLIPVSSVAFDMQMGTC
jgi:hypothetical protein